MCVYLCRLAFWLSDNRQAFLAGNGEDLRRAQTCFLIFCLSSRMTLSLWVALATRHSENAERCHLPEEHPFLCYLAGACGEGAWLTRGGVHPLDHQPLPWQICHQLLDPRRQGVAQKVLSAARTVRSAVDSVQEHIKIFWLLKGMPSLNQQMQIFQWIRITILTAWKRDSEKNCL